MAGLGCLGGFGLRGRGGLGGFGLRCHNEQRKIKSKEQFWVHMASKKQDRQAIQQKPWFVFLLSFSVLTAILLPIAEKVGYWTSAFPASLLLSLFPTAVAVVLHRKR